MDFHDFVIIFQNFGNEFYFSRLQKMNLWNVVFFFNFRNFVEAK